jgi:hypothetical protein
VLIALRVAKKSEPLKEIFHNTVQVPVLAPPKPALYEKPANPHVHATPFSPHTYILSSRILKQHKLIQLLENEYAVTVIERELETSIFKNPTELLFHMESRLDADIILDERSCIM